MRIRPAASDDALDVLDWRNDPESRAASGAGGAPIDREAHLQWFARALADPDRVILIGEQDGAKAGMIRFDRNRESGGGEGWTISIAIAPGRRGRGEGARLLAAGLAEMAARPPYVFFARIAARNTASLRLFSGAGFRETSRDGDFVTMRRDS